MTPRNRYTVLVPTIHSRSGDHMLSRLNCTNSETGRFAGYLLSEFPRRYRSALEAGRIGHTEAAYLRKASRIYPFPEDIAVQLRAC